MEFLSVTEMAKKWGLSERTVRNYCAQGKIDGAFLTGKTWSIPKDAKKPEKLKKATLLDVLMREKANKVSGGIYHKVQIELTYNSNHIEGSKLTHDQTRFIYETNTVGGESDTLRVDDIVETANHFRCIDIIIEKALKPITESLIKELHWTLKNGTSDSRLEWFNVGEYKKLPNEVGGMETTEPQKVSEAIRELIAEYNAIEKKTLDDIIDFHYRFEKIHPFQDGNGRVGRLILFKECLKYDIIPFVIDEHLKFYYYRGLSEWKNERGFLRETCMLGQDKFKIWLNYFNINYRQ
ncbi:MAG: Fic family protein [Clostridia bacterium]|nr:Fic family protein [Clostridia bacterium]